MIMLIRGSWITYFLGWALGLNREVGFLIVFVRLPSQS